ncbi:class I SAM-dependent methyltransferase [Rhodobium gokarnense]|uniref:SAM-dependent methyltransferase n=1 Tax=Rhodobium gokarnense TaxID=364296 RepID=A0ABT3HD26_9HYPH|nr:class I SAM-dependent methyltransferase [Rhodobium gokarnense]MCW2308287.1 SAM-dependent methyltransferase [Rhodobium gokarnense]
MLNFYRQKISPMMVHAVCGAPPLMREREQMVPKAEGVVVEIGIGTGRNLPFYDERQVRRLIGVNPPDGLTDLVDFERLAPGIEAEIVPESAENMSLDSNLADTVVVTYTLCSIPDVEKAIGEIRRVLKPGGRLLFVEHGRADCEKTARWQDRLNPYWGLISQGCHINRNPTELLTAGGFSFQEQDRYPLRRVPSVVGFHHVGVAVGR